MADEADRKPRILVYLESPFVLVALTGIIGNLLTGTFQDKARIREVRTEWVKSELQRRNDVVAKLEQRQLAMADTAFARFGRVIASADDIVRLRRDYWDPMQWKPAARARVRVQTANMRAAFNRDAEVWQRTAIGIGASLDHAYAGPESDLFSAWWELGDNVDRYIDVVDSTASQRTPKDPAAKVREFAARDSLCQASRNKVTASALRVSRLLRERRVLLLAETRRSDELAQVLGIRKPVESGQ